MAATSLSFSSCSAAMRRLASISAVSSPWWRSSCSAAAAASQWALGSAPRASGKGGGAGRTLACSILVLLGIPTLRMAVPRTGQLKK